MTALHTNIGTDPYETFLRAKAALAPVTGYSVDPGEINPMLYDFQRGITGWSLKRDRAALHQSKCLCVRRLFAGSVGVDFDAHQSVAGADLRQRRFVALGMGG